jgi:hypothetical protein
MNFNYVEQEKKILGRLKITILPNSEKTPLQILKKTTDSIFAHF